MSDVYSYHTFLFPFLWDDGGKVSRKRFEKVFKKNHNWCPVNWSGERIPQNESITGLADTRLAYNAYQYFNPSACRAIFGMGSNIVSNYSFMPKKLRGNASYCIVKDKVEYRLDINAIRLKIFNTGVAVMMFEMENSKHRKIEDVNMINQYGRRIAAPFLPGKNYYTLCADEIAVEFAGNRLETRFKENILKLDSSDDIVNKVSLTYISHVVKELLVFGCQTNYRLTSHRGHMSGRDCFYIAPIIDDRMYVACVVRDNDLVPGFRNGGSQNGFEGYRYKTDFASAKALYALCFIDGESSSCQDRQMIQKLLDTHLYTRWIEWDTIHAVTHHSIMCITGTGADDAVVNPFLTQYIEMAVLTIAQRASIINFELLASKITDGLEKPGSTIGRRRIRCLLNLQEKYLAFQNQLMFFEVTPQEQGIEIYDMMLESMYIKKEMEALEGQLQNLYEATNVNQDFSLNKWALVIAIAAFAPAVAGVLKDNFPGSALISSPWFMVALMLVPALCVFIIFRRGRK